MRPAPFAERLRSAKQLLLIGDNAGETVFDRILVEKLAANGVGADLCGPQSSRLSMIQRWPKHMLPGWNSMHGLSRPERNVPGLILDGVYPQANFRKSFKTADLILSKGQE